VQESLFLVTYRDTHSPDSIKPMTTSGLSVALALLSHLSHVPWLSKNIVVVATDGEL